MLIETTETKNMRSNFLKLDISVARFWIIYKNSRIFCLTSKNEIYHNDNRTKQCNFILSFISECTLIVKYMFLSYYNHFEQNIIQKYGKFDRKMKVWSMTVLKWIIPKNAYKRTRKKEATTYYSKIRVWDSDHLFT